MRQIEDVEEQAKILREERDTALQRKEKQILTLQQEAKQTSKEIDRLNVAYSSEVEQLKLEVRYLTSQNQLLVAKNEAKEIELISKVSLSEAHIKNTDKALKQEREEFATLLAKEMNQAAAEREQFEIKLSKEKELNETLHSEVSELANVENQLQFPSIHKFKIRR